MGYNATVVVLVDALDQIEKDQKFGKKLAAAISHMTIDRTPADVSAGNHCNAATVIETHHADNTAIVAVGQNYGAVVGMVWGNISEKERMLKQLADELGYRVSEKPKPKPRCREE